MRIYVSLIWHQPRVHDVSILMTMAAGDGLVPRRLAAFEDLDDDHAATAAGHGRGSTRG